MIATRHARGFTLIELMISVVIMLVAVSAAFAVMSNQNAMLKKQAGLGSAISQSELALDAIERSVRLAGTGIDAQFAFDFDFYRCSMPGVAASVNMRENANCVLGLRDSVVQPDELIVAYRDPAYSVYNNDARAGCIANNASYYAGKIWSVTAATAGSVTMLLKPGDTIYKGQVLQIACDDGKTYTYATVSGNNIVVPPAAPSCNAPNIIQLAGAQANDPFNQPGNLTATCFGNGNARAYAVRRQRYFIYRDTTASPPRPYLMLDQGIDLDNSGFLDDGDLLPIASDIEDLQVAYVTEQPGIMALSPLPPSWGTGANYLLDAGGDGIWGNQVGAAEQLTELATVNGTSAQTQFAAANLTLPGGAINCTAFATVLFYNNSPCLWGIPAVENSALSSVHAYRWVAWSGGVTAAIVGIVARSPGIDSADVISSDENTLPAVLNRASYGPSPLAPYPAWYAAIAPAGHKRVTVTTSVHPMNLSAFTPYWR
jgi:prepilin-type N-terminal cleavage/methylation domain-containing protein